MGKTRAHRKMSHFVRFVVIGIMKKVLFINFIFILSMHKGLAIELSDYLSLVRTEATELKIEDIKRKNKVLNLKTYEVSPPTFKYLKMDDDFGIRDGFEISQDFEFPTRLNTSSDIQKEKIKLSQIEFKKNTNLILGEARFTFISLAILRAKEQNLKESIQLIDDNLKILNSISQASTEASLLAYDLKNEKILIENELSNIEFSIQENLELLYLYAPSLREKKISLVMPQIENIERNKSTSYLEQEGSKKLHLLEKEINLKEQNRIPDLSLSYRKYNKSNLMGESKEIMIGITMPFLFFGDRKKETEEAKAEKVIYESELKLNTKKQETYYESIFNKLQSQYELLQNFDQKILPNLKSKIAISNNLASRTVESIQKKYEIRIKLKRYELDKLNIRLNYEKLLQSLKSIKE